MPMQVDRQNSYGASGDERRAGRSSSCARIILDGLEQRSLVLEPRDGLKLRRGRMEEELSWDCIVGMRRGWRWRV